TCSDELQHRLAKLITEYGGIPLRCPLINLLPEESAKAVLANVHQYDWVVLTSPSAAMFFARMIEDAGVDWRALPEFIVAGPGTDDVLRKHHIRVNVKPVRPFGNEGLLAAVRQHVRNGVSVLRCRSDQADDSISAALRESGAQVTDCVLYRNIPIRYHQRPGFDAAVFVSGSAVRAFVANWGAAALTEALPVAIGRPTAMALESCGCKSFLVAPDATAESMVRTLAAHCVEQDLETWMEKGG
ncbi:MAG: uroporphyrinogen-III synthase, partial [Kiritimatiellota bacterium]|nr:uroporphyrinogen-III synthase [Kiritimatiellota bacterium]